MGRGRGQPRVGANFATVGYDEYTNIRSLFLTRISIQSIWIPDYACRLSLKINWGMWLIVGLYDQHCIYPALICFSLFVPRLNNNFISAQIDDVTQ